MADMSEEDQRDALLQLGDMKGRVYTYPLINNLSCSDGTCIIKKLSDN